MELTLLGVEDRLPSELSGGMKKRVALARSIIFYTTKDAIEPEFFIDCNMDGLASDGDGLASGDFFPQTISVEIEQPRMMGDMKIEVGKIFDEIVLGESKDVLLELSFISSWMGLSTMVRALPTFGNKSSDPVRKKGAEVRIDCKFKAISPRTIEEIKFSSYRNTDKFRVYKLEIPFVDGIECTREKVIESSCSASLMWSTSSSFNVPGYRTTSGEIVVKSRQGNLCIYSLAALNYRLHGREITICQN